MLGGRSDCDIYIAASCLEFGFFKSGLAGTCFDFLLVYYWLGGGSASIGQFSRSARIRLLGIVVRLCLISAVI